MANTYTLQVQDGRKITLQAPDDQTAQAAAAQWANENPMPRAAAPKSAAYRASAKNAQAMFGDGGEVASQILNGLSFNNADRISGGAAAAGAAIRNFFGDKSVNPADAYAATRDTVRTNDAQFSKAHPAMSMGLQFIGGAPVGEAAGQFIAKGANAAQALGRSVVAGVGTGAAYGAGGDKEHPLRGAVQGGAIGGALGAVVPLIANGARSLVNGAPKTGETAIAGSSAPPSNLPPDQALLAQHGVRMTPGQIAGGGAKFLEDAATSTPILGPAIIKARNAANESLNIGVLNHALSNIGEALPSNVKAGHEAIAEAGNRISAAYTRAVPKGGVIADGDLQTALGAPLADLQSTMTADSRARVADIVKQRVTDRLNPNGSLTGETYQRVQSELGREITRQTRNGDPEGIGEALQHVSTSLLDAARRQNPRFASQMDKADAAYALLTRAERAAGGAGAEGGVFTPAQYANAVRMGDARIRSRGFARGEALGQDIAGAAKRVMSSKIPDSGTATRGMVGMMLGGASGAAGGPVGVAASVAGLGAARLAYGAANRAAQSYLEGGAAGMASTKSIAVPLGRSASRIAGQSGQVAPAYDPKAGVTVEAAWGDR